MTVLTKQDIHTNAHPQAQEISQEAEKHVRDTKKCSEMLSPGHDMAVALMRSTAAVVSVRLR